jgi:hypothetical protein
VCVCVCVCVCAGVGPDSGAVDFPVNPPAVTVGSAVRRCSGNGHITSGHSTPLQINKDKEGDELTRIKGGVHRLLGVNIYI